MANVATLPTVVSGTLAATGVSAASNSFRPLGAFTVYLDFATGSAVGTAKLQVKRSGDSAFRDVLGASWTTGPVDQVVQEPEEGAEYQVSFTRTSGTLAYRMGAPSSPKWGFGGGGSSSSSGSSNIATIESVVPSTKSGVVGTIGEVLIDSATGSPVVFSNPSLTTGQNALSTVNEVVLAANASRIFAEVTNTDAAINVFIGKDNTVTTANGHILKPGASMSFEGYTGAIWAIAASGTPNVTFMEY